MTRRLVAFLLVIWPLGAFAEQGAALTDAQRTGRLLFEQSCGVCHTKPTLTSPRYAPALSRESLGGKADVIRDVIANGTPRMPGFKYLFDHSQIDAIVAYLQTMPKPPEPPGR